LLKCNIIINIAIGRKINSSDMKPDDFNDPVITEEEKNSIRLDAVTNEVNRLKTVVRRKNKTITFYKLTFSLFILLIFTIVTLAFDVFTLKEAQTVNVQNDAVVKTDSLAKRINLISAVDTTEPVKLKYYTVFFKDVHSFPLAQFEQRNKADEFCKLLNQMFLPTLEIVYDVEFIPEPGLKDDSPNMYQIQIGAYSEDILEAYKSNLISIKHEFDANLHKYSITPFHGYSQSLEFVRLVQLEKAYITSRNT